MFHKRLRVCRFVSVAAARSAHPVGVSCTVAEWSQPRLWVEPKFHAQEMRPMPRKGPAARSGAFSSLIRYAPGGCCDLRVNEYTAFCNRDLRFWSEGNADYWSGTSVKYPDRTMAGRIGIHSKRQWLEYVEKHYRGGKLESTTTFACRPIKPEIRDEDWKEGRKGA